MTYTRRKEWTLEEIETQISNGHLNESILQSKSTLPNQPSLENLLVGLALQCINLHDNRVTFLKVRKFLIYPRQTHRKAETASRIRENKLPHIG